MKISDERSAIRDRSELAEPIEDDVDAGDRAVRLHLLDAEEPGRYRPSKSTRGGLTDRVAPGVSVTAIIWLSLV